MFDCAHWQSQGARIRSAVLMKLVNPYTIGPMALLLSWILRAWLGTIQHRVHYDDPTAIPADGATNKIYLFWHEMLLFPAHTQARKRFAVLASKHRDGELIVRILRM